LSSIKKLASQFAVYGMSNIVGRFLNYLLVPLYTGIFEPSAYGINVMLYSYVAFFNVLLTYGMETAFFRFASKHENPSKVYATALISLLCSSMVFVFFASFFSPQIASLILIPEYPQYVTMFVWILALDAMSSIPFAYLRQQSKPVRFAVIKNINILLNVGLNLYFFLLGPYLAAKGIKLPYYEATVGIGYIFISNLVASIVTLLLFMPEIMKMRAARFDAQLWKQMLIYGLPMMVVGFAGMINETIDRVFISWFYDDTEVGRSMNGIYGANYKLAVLMTLFVQAFRYAAEPFFFAHAANSDKKEIYARVMNYFVATGLLVFLFVVQYLDVFADLFLRNKSFHSGLHVVAPLLIANLFLGIYYNLSVWYKVTDHTKKGALISIIGALITIALNLWWIPIFGYTGAAYATLVCYISMAIIGYIWGQRYFHVPYQVLKLLGYIVFALMLYYSAAYATPILSVESIFIKRVIQFIPIGVFAVVVYYFESKDKTLISQG
jgi:O-antigen/teichoic acid export membrane protein